MTFDERYLSIAQEVYLQTVKENSSALLDYDMLVMQAKLAEMAVLADYAAAAFIDQFESEDRH
jgi:hypothetical protein